MMQQVTQMQETKKKIISKNKHIKMMLRAIGVFYSNLRVGFNRLVLLNKNLSIINKQMIKMNP
jgi:hypothetical protein